MKTVKRKPQWLIHNFSLYPTFKEWKLNFDNRNDLSFLSLYPTFKEWKLLSFKCNKITFFVYILPLRNENVIVRYKDTIASFGLYPTFKEWKQ